MKVYYSEVIRNRIRKLTTKEFTIQDLSWDEKSPDYKHEEYLKTLPSALKRFRDNNELRVVRNEKGSRKEIKLKNGGKAVVLEVVALRSDRKKIEYTVKKRNRATKEVIAAAVPVYTPPPTPKWADVWQGCWEILKDKDYKQWRENTRVLYA